MKNMSLTAVIFVGILGCTPKVILPPGTLVVAIGAQPATLDPRFATDAYGMRIDSLIFSSLVHIGKGFEPEPDAAAKWILNKDTYTFYLRPDLRFHNGRPVEAEDVEFSFHQYLKKGGSFSSMLDTIEKVEVKGKPGAITVQIKVRSNADKFLRSDLPSIRILPKREMEANEAEFTKTLMGTGGFKLVRQDSTEIELEGVTSKAKHVLFKIIRDDFTRYQKIMKGDIDIAQNEILPDRVAEFQKRAKDFRVLLSPGTSMTYLLVNFKDPLLKKLDVRQALARSISRDELIRYKMEGMADPATSILAPTNPYHNGALKNLDYAPELAQRTIADLGLNGSALTLKTSNSPQAVDEGKVLAHEMSKSGLKIDIQSYEWGTFYNDVKHGGFQLALMRWVGIVDPEIYRMAFHSSETPPGRNRGSYINAQVDRLLEEGANALEREKRKDIFNKVQALVLEDLAIIPLWYDQQVAIVKTDVLGFSPSTTGDYWPLLEAHKAHD